MVTGRYFAILAAVGALLHTLSASDSAPAPMTSPERQEAVFVDALSVPCPGEVFAAMNRVCRPNWAALVTPATAPVSSDRSQLALAVGVLAADGYVAVEAQDGQQVKNIGREIMALAKGLGVSQSLMGRGNSLIEFADNGAWEALADELEATENEVKVTMVEQKDRELVTLTSAAAWIRGLEVASGVVLGSESLQGLGILRQSSLARSLARQVAGLPGRMGKSGLVTLTAGTLESCATLLDSPDLDSPGKKGADAPLIGKRRETLRKIHDDTGRLVREILTSSGKSSPSPSPAGMQGSGSAATSPGKNP